jgi:hypothetical protein
MPSLLNRDRLRSHHTLFCAASIGVCLVAYADVVFAGKTFLPIGFVPGTYGAPPFAAGYQGRPAPLYPEVDAGAEAWFVHPLAYHERRALGEGTLPFWNRHNGLGWPMLSDGQVALFSPLHWIELINPDWPVLWDLHHLLLRFLAALFTCYLLSRLGASPPIAALGAPIAAIHGSFTAMVARADLNACALMPVLLYCVVRLREERDARSTFALGTALYLVLTVGHPQPAAAVLLPSALIAAGLAVWPRGEGPLRYLALAAIASLLALLISAPYWLPFLGNVQRSWTIHPPGLGSQSAPPGRALQWLVPGIFARSGRTAFLDAPATAQTFLGGAAGTLAVLGVVAVFALPAARRRAVWLAVPLLFALKIFGFAPLQWMGRLPLLEQMWFSYFGFAVLYLLALCGLLALQDLVRTAAGPRLLVLRITAILVIGALVLSPAYEPPPWVFGGLSRYLLPLVAIYSSIALVTLLLAYFSAGPRGPVSIAALGVLLLVELTSYRYRLSDRGNPTAAAPFVRWLQERQRSSPPFRVMGLGDWLNPNYSSAFGLDDVRLCDALMPPEQVQFIHRYLQSKLLFGWFLHASPQSEGFRIPAGMLNLMNVRYLIGFPSGIEDYIARNRVAYSDAAMSGGVIVENQGAWPRIFAVQQPHLEASREAALERLGSLDASAPFAVVADDFPRERWSELCGAGCGGRPLRQQVSDIRYGINDLSFRAAVDGPAVLVVSDTLAAGWRASVDGAEQPIFRANYLFRGILLGAGDHEIRFSFSPPGWRLSLWLAGIGLLACVALGAGAALRRRSGSNVGVASVVANLSD